MAQHLDANLLSVALIVLKALRPVVTKAVVIARQQHPHAQSVVHQLHKLACRQASHLAVEAQHHHHVDACGLQQLQLFVKLRQELWLPIPLHHLARMALKGDGHRQ